jgi:hypothetical protein
MGRSAYGDKATSMEDSGRINQISTPRPEARGARGAWWGEKE